MLTAKLRNNGKVYTHGEGEIPVMIMEARYLLHDLMGAIRGNSKTENEYAENLFEFMGLMDYMNRAARGEAEALAETAEEYSVAKGIRVALEELDKKRDMSMDEMRAEAARMIEKVMRQEDESRDPEKVNELEEALRRRMQGE